MFLKTQARPGVVHRDRRDLEPLDAEEDRQDQAIKRYNSKSAVRAIRNIFKLQRLNKRRITRIYIYNWYAPG